MSRTLQSDAFAIRRIGRGETQRLVAAGELDLVSAQRMEDEVVGALANGAPRVVLDLSSLTFIDSSGVRAILRCMGYAEAHSRQFAIIPGSRSVRVFELVGLYESLSDRAERPRGARLIRVAGLTPYWWWARSPHGVLQTASAHEAGDRAKHRKADDQHGRPKERWR